MRQRVGVYGGMFDPVHKGHLALARYAQQALNLDKVLFVPCKLPNHREAAHASGSQRLAMLRLACEGEPGFEPSAVELERDGVSYSVDTLAELRSEHEDLVFLMGRDALASLPGWERWEALLDEGLTAVVSRPDAVVADDVAQTLRLSDRLVESPEALFAARRGRLILLDGLANSLSSSAVRGELARGKGAGEALPAAVQGFIRAERLYGFNQEI